LAGNNATDNSSSNNGLAVVGFFVVLIAAIVIPIVVFLILDLNDALNEMFLLPAAAILSIGAARMYRSLSDRGSLTVYVSSNLPQFPSGNSVPSALRRDATIHFASVMQSDGAHTTDEAPVFLQADQIHLELTPGNSTPSLGQEDPKDRPTPTTYEVV